MIITRNPKMLELLQRARQVAEFSVPVLLYGETGTGKELLAELLHEQSSRRGKSMVKVNCAALSENFISSELFGQTRGVGADLTADRKGRFEQAHESTLLLDEVSEIPLALQPKLLRAIENQEFERVGCSQTISTNVRVLAATNRDLNQLVAEGCFRLDLLHRLNVVQLSLPRLEERAEDIPVLAQYFAEQFCTRAKCRPPTFENAAMDRLLTHNWPGNVRELRNVVQRACINAMGYPSLSADHILVQNAPDIVPFSPACNLPDDWAGKDLAEIERQVIEANIEKHGSHRIAAEHLGVSTRTLTNKMKKYRESDRRRAA